MEHELAGHRGFVIRMCGDAGSWIRVASPQAREIRQNMRARVSTLWADLEKYSLFRGDADVQVDTGLAEFGRKSVDLVLKASPVSELGACQILLEVKWTRQRVASALEAGMKSFGWLKQACKTGRWHKSRKPVKADYFGALVLKPNDWQLVLRKVGDEDFQAIYPASKPPVRALRDRRGRSGWSDYKGDAKPGDPRWPSGASSTIGASGWPEHNRKRTAAAQGRPRKRPARAL